MKKLFFAIAAVAVIFATSCKKESVNEPVSPEEIPANSFLCEIENGSATQKILSRIGDGMGTKTTINTAHQVIWENGDRISVNLGPNGNVFTNNQETGTNRAYFENASYPNGFQAAAYHAFYPSDIQTGTGNNAGTNYGTLKSAISYDPQHPAAELPMYAYNTNHWLTFHNICAVFEIAIPASITTCDKIELHANENICGSFTVADNTTATPYALLNESGDCKTITVTPENDTYFTADSKVYVAIPADDYTGFTIKL